MTSIVPKKGVAKLIDEAQVLEMSQDLEEQFKSLLTQLDDQIRRRVEFESPSVSLFHDLKGATSSMGLAELSRLAAMHEDSCRKEEPLPPSWEAPFLELLECSLEEISRLLQQAATKKSLESGKLESSPDSND